MNWFNLVGATYKADIKQLNELNFQRFEATLKQGLAELKADLLKWMFGFWASAILTFIALSLRA